MLRTVFSKHTCAAFKIFDLPRRKLAFGKRQQHHPTARSAEDTGYAALFRVEEQLAKIAGRIDKAKQNIHFPEVRGYQ